MLARLARNCSQISLCTAALLCACSSPPTTLRLHVLYEEAWSLTQLELTADSIMRSARVSATHELLITLSPNVPVESVMIRVVGHRGNDRYAGGRVSVAPVHGQEVRAEVLLNRIPCGDWCARGSTRCEGDSVVVCEQRDDDDCFEWSAPIACSAEAPDCALGTCLAECVDECSEGETQCAGPHGIRRCGQVPGSDHCLDWMPVEDCPADEVCSLGHCRSSTSCVDECTEGSERCIAGGLSQCGDPDFDGCLEWGPATACEHGTSCSDGRCISLTECVDECDASSCDGDVFTRCGNSDLDPCRDRGIPERCPPVAGCNVGTCTPTGCTIEAGACPDASVTDAGSLDGGTCVPQCGARVCGTDSVCGQSCGQCSEGRGIVSYHRHHRFRRAYFGRPTTRSDQQHHLHDIRRGGRQYIRSSGALDSAG